MTPPFDYDNARDLKMTPDGNASGGETGRGVGEVVPGGPDTVERLKKAGIVSVEDLVKRCAAPADREAIATRTGIAASHLLAWATSAELLRIGGITPEFAAMLAAVGADSIEKLRDREADRLADAMLALTAERSMTGLIPSAAILEGWIRHARRLTPIVTGSTVSGQPPRRD